MSGGLSSVSVNSLGQLDNSMSVSEMQTCNMKYIDGTDPEFWTHIHQNHNIISDLSSSGVANYFTSPDIMERQLAELKASCSAHYGLSYVLPCLGESLQSQLEKRENLKIEFLKAVEGKLFLDNFEKHPEELLTMKVSETQLSESKDILSNRMDEIHAIVDLASDALDILKDKLVVLEEKIGILGKKHKELNELSVATINTVHTSDIKCMAQKVIELLNLAQIERDIMTGRVQRMEVILSNFEEQTSLKSSKVAASRSQLTQMEERLKELEKLSGMRCHLKDATSLVIYFSSAQSLNDCNIGVIPDDLLLTVTLTFCENEHKCLVLEDVQISQMAEEAKNLIADAKLDKDLPKLMDGLKKMWLTHVPLITEISQIKCRHAVDWIQEKGMLFLIPRKSKSVVCALKVPSTYPFSGQVVLESVIGHTCRVDPEDIQPSSTQSLTGWVMCLEELFSLS